jgi:hypothetical protein
MQDSAVFCGLPANPSLELCYRNGPKNCSKRPFALASKSRRTSLNRSEKRFFSDISGLPGDALELVLAKMLDEYRQARTERLRGASRRQQVEAGLLTCNLQQRLLSSVYGFSRTLKVHASSILVARFK